MFQQFQTYQQIHEAIQFHVQKKKYQSNLNLSEQNVIHAKDIIDSRNENENRNQIENNTDENTYRKQTLRKDQKLNKTLLGNFQQKQSDEYVGKIYQNKQSTVDLIFDITLNKFIVSKENKGEIEIFQREYKILEQLKDSKVTLDILTPNRDNNKFQQVAGKTDLYSLKQKRLINFDLLNIYYFILLDKLNRMHQKGIAHSDIKPQNIVISYENEPYFIDFGASINLFNENDYQFYLYYRTSRYNLSVYLAKEFKDKEDIKLCDRTQLSITFLCLFCNDEKQLQLFKYKNYNELIQNLMKQYSRGSLHQQNQKLVFSIISRILNDADPSIKIVENENVFEYYFDSKNLTDILQESNNITFENEVFRVQCIDKFSILLIYFLDKQNCKLMINPNFTQITLLHDMEEYKFISEKYQINDYFENLINANHYLNHNNFFNICEYIQKNQITKQKMLVEYNSWQLQFQTILKKISILNSLISLELFITNIDLDNFIEYLKKYQHCNLYIESFQILGDLVNCKVVKDLTLNKQPNIQVKYLVSELKEYNLDKKFEMIQNNYDIKQLEILYECKYNYQGMIDDNIIINDIKKIIQQMNPDKGFQSFKFERKLKIKKYSEYKIPKVIKEMSFKFNYQCLEHKIQSQNDLKDFIKKIYKQQQSNTFCYQCQQVISSIKQDISIQVELFTQKILKINNPNLKIVVQINDYVFEQMEMWQEISQMIKVNHNFYFELIFVNCQFSQKVQDILKEFKPIYDYSGKYEFHEYIQYDKSDHNFLKYQFKIEQRDLYGQNGYKIILIDKQITEQLQKNDNEKDSLQAQRPETKNNEKQNEQRNSFNASDIVKIHQIFKQQTFDFIDLKELKIQYKKYSQNILFFYKYQYKECNRNSIDLFIQEIKNKKIFSDIYFYNKNSNFQLSYKHSEDLVICYYYEDIETFKLYEELFQVIYNNYYLLFPKYYNDYFKLFPIKFEMVYSFYSIIEQIYEKNLDDKYLDILSFLELDINQFSYYDSPYSENNKFLLSKYQICLNQNFEYKDYDQEQELFEIRELFKNSNLKEDFNHFQKYSITKSEITSIFFKDKLPLIQFTFISFNNYTKIIFEEVEKNFQQNIMYKFNKLGSQPLDDLYEVIKACQQKHKICFDLFQLIQYCEFKQFINKIKKDNLSNQFIFQIKMQNNEVKSQLIEDFKDICEINYIDRYIIFYVKQIQPIQKESKTIKIYLELESDDDECDDGDYDYDDK